MAQTTNSKEQYIKTSLTSAVAAMMAQGAGYIPFLFGPPGGGKSTTSTTIGALSVLTATIKMLRQMGMSDNDITRMLSDSVAAGLAHAGDNSTALTAHNPDTISPQAAIIKAQNPLKIHPADVPAGMRQHNAGAGCLSDESDLERVPTPGAIAVATTEELRVGQVPAPILRILTSQPGQVTIEDVHLALDAAKSWIMSYGDGNIPGTVASLLGRFALVLTANATPDVLTPEVADRLAIFLFMPSSEAMESTVNTVGADVARRLEQQRDAAKAEIENAMALVQQAKRDVTMAVLGEGEYSQEEAQQRLEVAETQLRWAQRSYRLVTEAINSLEKHTRRFVAEQWPDLIQTAMTLQPVLPSPRYSVVNGVAMAMDVRSDVSETVRMGAVALAKIWADARGDSWAAVVAQAKANLAAWQDENTIKQCSDLRKKYNALGDDADASIRQAFEAALVECDKMRSISWDDVIIQAVDIQGNLIEVRAGDVAELTRITFDTPDEMRTVLAVMEGLSQFDQEQSASERLKEESGDIGNIRTVIEAFIQPAARKIMGPEGENVADMPVEIEMDTYNVMHMLSPRTYNRVINTIARVAKQLGHIRMTMPHGEERTRLEDTIMAATKQFLCSTLPDMSISVAGQDKRLCLHYYDAFEQASKSNDSLAGFYQHITDYATPGEMMLAMAQPLAQYFSSRLTDEQKKLAEENPQAFIQLIAKDMTMSRMMLSNMQDAMPRMSELLGRRMFQVSNSPVDNGVVVASPPALAKYMKEHSANGITSMTMDLSFLFDKKKAQSDEGTAARAAYYNWRSLMQLLEPASYNAALRTIRGNKLSGKDAEQVMADAVAGFIARQVNAINSVAPKERSARVTKIGLGVAAAKMGDFVRALYGTNNPIVSGMYHLAANLGKINEWVAQAAQQENDGQVHNSDAFASGVINGLNMFAQLNRVVAARTQMMLRQAQKDELAEDERRMLSQHADALSKLSEATAQELAEAAKLLGYSKKEADKMLADIAEIYEALAQPNTPAEDMKRMRKRLKKMAVTLAGNVGEAYFQNRSEPELKESAVNKLRALAEESPAVRAMLFRELYMGILTQWQGAALNQVAGADIDDDTKSRIQMALTSTDLGDERTLAQRIAEQLSVDATSIGGNTPQSAMAHLQNVGSVMASTVQHVVSALGQPVPPPNVASMMKAIEGIVNDAGGDARRLPTNLIVLKHLKEPPPVTLSLAGALTDATKPAGQHIVEITQALV